MLGPKGGAAKDAFTLLDVVSDPAKYKSKIQELIKQQEVTDKLITKNKEREKAAVEQEKRSWIFFMKSKKKKPLSKKNSR